MMQLLQEVELSKWSFLGKLFLGVSSYLSPLICVNSKSSYLRDHSRSIAGKEQLIIAAMAKALEVIPRQLCDNAGFDATNILNKLRQKHAQVMTIK